MLDLDEDVIEELSGRPSWLWDILSGSLKTRAPNYILENRLEYNRIYRKFNPDIVKKMDENRCSVVKAKRKTDPEFKKRLTDSTKKYYAKNAEVLRLKAALKRASPEEKKKQHERYLRRKNNANL